MESKFHLVVDSQFTRMRMLLLEFALYASLLGVMVAYSWISVSNWIGTGRSISVTVVYESFAKRLVSYQDFR